jgi:hypothetical protein
MVWLPMFPVLFTVLLFLVFLEVVFLGIVLPNSIIRSTSSLCFVCRSRTVPDPSPLNPLTRRRWLLRLFLLPCLGANLLCGQCFLMEDCHAQSFDAPVIRHERPTSEGVESLKEVYKQSEWRDIATGLQIKVVELSTGFLSGEITLLKTSLSHFRPQVVRAASFQRNGADVEWYSKRTGASACINAHFFDQKGSPLGLVVSRGIEHQRMQLGGTLLTGLFLAYHKRVEIIQRDKNHKAGLEAIQSGPRLIINRTAANDLDDINESRRSGICTTSPTEYILFVASSPFRGATLKELGDILSSPEIQCEDALNFDGGGSTQLFVRQDLTGAQVGFRGIHVLGRDEVPTVLCLFPAS